MSINAVKELTSKDWSVTATQIFFLLIANEMLLGIFCVIISMIFMWNFIWNQFFGSIGVVLFVLAALSIIPMLLSHFLGLFINIFRITSFKIIIFIYSFMYVSVLGLLAHCIFYIIGGGHIFVGKGLFFCFMMAIPNMVAFIWLFRREAKKLEERV